MDFLKSRFYSFVDDKLQRTSLIMFFIITVVSFLNFIEYRNAEWLFRLCLYGLGILLTFFIGNKGTWITWLISSFVMFYFSNYRNISYFVIITLLTLFYPKVKLYLNICYGIQVFIICHLHDIPVKNILYHITLCCGVYIITNIIKSRIDKTKKLNGKLDLTEDEKIILEYLLQDVQQNDIPEFHPVTVSRKLRQAKVRNTIGSTKELVELYKLQKSS